MVNIFKNELRLQKLGVLGFSILTLVAGILPVSAQDALRASLAGEAAAKARRAQEEVPYNIKAGPVSIRFSSGLGLSYVDNVGVNSANAQEEIFVAPSFNVAAIWPVTPQNQINFTLGLSYNAPLLGNGFANLTITPGSETSFDFYVGDFRFNIHDRFSYYQNPLQQAQISGGTNSLNAARFGVAQNLAGISADWDLNRMVLSFGYDHQSSFATDSSFSYIDSSADFFFIRASGVVSPGVTTGVEGTAGFTRLQQTIRSDSSQFSFGPFVNWQISQFLNLTARGGYSLYSFDGSSTITNSSDSASFYGSIGVDHVMNQYFSHALSISYQTSQGVNSDAVRSAFVRHNGRLRIMRSTTINTDLFYENGQEIRATSPDTFDRYGFTIGFGYAITRHLNSNFNYSYVEKSAEITANSYRSHSVTVNLDYQF